MKQLTFFAATLLLSSCGINEMQLRNSEGLVHKSTYSKAIQAATLVQDVNLRGQILKVSLANVKGKPYGVLQFVEGGTGRVDQPKVTSEVIPLAERILGCSFPDRRKFDEGSFMPRNEVLVLPIDCVDIFQG